MMNPNQIVGITKEFKKPEWVIMRGRAIQRRAVSMGEALLIMERIANNTVKEETK